MKKVFLFTDASHMPANCPKNLSKSGFGSYAYCFNYKGKAVGSAKLIENAYSSDYCEGIAILKGIEAIVRKYGDEAVKIVVHADNEVSVNRLRGDIGLLPIKKRKRTHKAKHVAMLTKTIMKRFSHIDIEFNHVRGHVNLESDSATVIHEYNHFCDRAAKVIATRERDRRNDLHANSRHCMSRDYQSWYDRNVVRLKDTCETKLKAFPEGHAF